MSVFLTKVCSCFGRVVNDESQAIKEYTEYTEYNFNNLNHEELATSLKRVIMRS